MTPAAGRLVRWAVLPFLLSLAACETFGDPDLDAALEDFQTLPPEVSVEAAEAALAAGNLVRARQLYASLLAANAGDPRVAVGAAEVLLASGDGPEALKVFASVEDAEQYRARSLQGQGLVLLSVGNWNRLERLCRRRFSKTANCGAPGTAWAGITIPGVSGPRRPMPMPRHCN